MVRLWRPNEQHIIPTTSDRSANGGTRALSGACFAFDDALYLLKREGELIEERG